MWVVVWDATHTLHKAYLEGYLRWRLKVKDMNTRRMPARRVEVEVVNEGVPPQGDQGLQGDQVHQKNEVPVVSPDMTNKEIRTAFLTLAQTMMAQVNRDVGPRVIVNESTVTSRLRDFVRMNLSWL
uniref:Uncharacterized protein n=1 Tax=Solanum tuberosum TaxID=4113 RepID=M1DM10_SOLTU